MAFEYDTEAGLVQTAFTFRHTVIPTTLGRCDFWIFFALHITIVVLFRTGYLKAAEEKTSPEYLDWNDMKVVTAIATFFEVFYTNQCYTRYLHLYDQVKKMLGNAINMSVEAALHMKGTCPQHVVLANRYHLASMVLFFSQMEECVDPELRDKLTKALIKPDEAKYLDHFDPSQRSIICLQWCADVQREAHTRAKAPANILKSLSDKVLKARDFQQEVWDTQQLPVPFQYFHLLNVMLTVNITLWAYVMGVTEAYSGTICFFFAELIFMGMVEMAGALADPFGSDEVDFPVNEWLSETFHYVVVVLNYKRLGHAEDWAEIASKEKKLKHPSKLIIGHEQGVPGSSSGYEKLEEQPPQALRDTHDDDEAEDDDDDDDA
mmetsp:Transcript_51404/g.92608  ORF Transcript_51404/g.92608 Transcript_51404/m.92608 type:complete len:377 (+) Transcript_51404:120-1250(+)